MGDWGLGGRGYSGRGGPGRGGPVHYGAWGSPVVPVYGGWGGGGDWGGDWGGAAAGWARGAARGSGGRGATVVVARAREPTHTLEDLKRENDFLAAENMRLTAELDSVMEMNSVLRPIVRQREAKQAEALNTQIADLTHAQECLDEEDAKEDAEAREKAELEMAASFGGSIVRIEGQDAPPVATAVAAPSPFVATATATTKKLDPTDPRQNWEALLKLYCQVHSLQPPTTDQYYENYLTKASMVIDDPTGKKVTGKASLPGRPAKDKIQAKLIEATMKICYPGKDQPGVVTELTKLMEARELLKREKKAIQARNLYEQVTGFTAPAQATPLQQSAMRSLGRGYSMYPPPAFAAHMHGR
eukprot:TRINITY_DN72463_c0_g1_i1.p1 TRINITY_DN72463_c0_g1~~TRINITY_DN72463_c0_g1_i1.p1  ORF type:complete len:388 (+),score=106.73 TRINITY_DN72463_c0_g1_i1:91-1164(+)